MQWSERREDGRGKVDCMRVLQTTFVESGQPGPP